VTEEYNTFKILQCEKFLPYFLETVYPTMYLNDTNEVVVIDTTLKGGYSNVVPKIFAFQVENLEYVIPDNKPAGKELVVAKKEVKPNPIQRAAEAFILQAPVV
jgi:hypothetical protein